MKKIMLLLLAGVVILTAAGAGMLAFSQGFAEKPITAFIIEADAAYTAAMRTQNAEAVDALQALLREAQITRENLSKAKSLATIQTELQDGAGPAYTLLLQDGRLYAEQAGQTGKPRELDAEAFYALLFSLDHQFYTYRGMPTLTITGADSALSAQSGSYRYRRLDGRYYSSKAKGSAELPRLDLNLQKELPVFTFSRSGAAVRVSLQKGGATVYSGTWAGLAQYGGTGVHTADITAVWESEYYAGELTYRVELNLSSPISFSVTGADTYPGELMVLRARHVPEGTVVRVESDFAYAPVFFDQGGGTRIALFPVSYFSKPGSYRLSLFCGDVSETFSVTVREKQFQTQNMTVSSETAQETINNQRANAEYEKVIAPLRFVGDSRCYWSMPEQLSAGFAWPSTGRRSTEFGMIRYVNGAPTSSRHGAIDFAIPKGTEVPSTASGRVLYAGFLQLTGNTVLIEHGYGLKSWYYHMDSLSVTTGDLVQKGQIIGKVGSTGFSTGPHLHFGISVNNVFVNPDSVVGTDLLDMAVT